MASRIDGVVAGWVNSGIADEDERDAQTGLFGRLTMACFAIPAGLAPLLLFVFSPGIAFAAGVGAGAMPLLCAAALCVSGSRRACGAVMLACAVAVIGLLASATGGPASPFMVWLLILPLEAMVAARNLRALCVGLGAALAGGAAVSLIAAQVRVFANPARPDMAVLAVAGGLVVYACVRLASGLSVSHAGGRAGDLASTTGKTPHAQSDRATIYDRCPGLVTLHDLKGHVLSVHGADAATILTQVETPLGSGFVRQIHVADRIGFLQALDALRLGGARARVELRMHRRRARDRQKTEAGEQFVHLHVDLCAYREADGAPTLIQAHSRDITDEVVLRAEAAQQAIVAESAEAAKAQFLAAVSHELRTPLNAILGFSDVLANDYFGTLPDERQRDYVDLIRQSGTHLLSVVNTMLDMSRIEAGRYALAIEPFDVKEAVLACEAMLALQAREKDITLASRVSPACGLLAADGRAVHQIIINLLANAIKFTDEGGVVTVDAELRGDMLRLSVSDTGIGIAPERIGTIGHPFVQIDSTLAREHDGTGLGLALVKGLVALHGGRFEIVSEPGRGTVVTVELARDGSGARALDPAETGAAGPQGNPPLNFPPPLGVRDSAAEESRNDHMNDMDERDDPQARTA